MSRYIIKFKDTGSRVSTLAAQGRLNRLKEETDEVKLRQEFKEGVQQLHKEFKSKKDIIKNKINSRSNKCKIKAEYENIPELMAVEIECEETLRELQSDPSIEIKKDGLGYGAAQSMDWGYVRTKVNARYRGQYTGSGVKVAIVDSGIRPDHEDLPYPSAWKDFVNNMPSPYDDQGHGTFIAGIIAAKDNSSGYVGVAPNASIYVCKVFNANNFGYVSDSIAGIDWAIAQGVHLINFSIVSETYNEDLVSATRRAYNAGIIVVACSGNGTLIIDNETGRWTYTGKSSVDCPAVDYSCIGVGSISQDDQRSGFSNYGTGLDIVAPGDNVASSYISSSSSYVSWSGTSFATAYVTGHLAALKSKYPAYSHFQLKNEILNKAEKLNNYSFDGLWNYEVGYGLITAIGSDPPKPNAPSSPYFDTAYGVDGRSEDLTSIGAGIFYVKWNPPTNSTNIIEYEFSMREVGASSWSTSTGSGTTRSFYVIFGYSYEMRVRAKDSFGQYGDYSNISVGTMYPKNPLLSVDSISQNNVVVTPSIVGSGIAGTVGKYSGILIRVTDMSGVIAFEKYSPTGNGVTVTCSGLKSNTNYVVSARTYIDVDGVRLWGMSTSVASKSFTTSGLSRPTNFAWSTAKTSGANFNVTASEWRSFQDKISEFRAYKNLSTVTWTRPNAGNTFTASIYNQVADSFSGYGIGGSSQGLNQFSSQPYNDGRASPGGDIYASFFNNLRNALNNIP